VKDSILVNCSIAMCTVFIMIMVMGAYSTYYRYLYEDDPKTIVIIEIANKVPIIICVGIYTLTYFRWFRLVTIRHNSCIIPFGRLSISEKRFILSTMPIVFFTMIRAVSFFFYSSSSRTSQGFWTTQTEFSLMVDQSGQYLTLAIASSNAFM
jgi:hypothetical protein